MDLSRKTGTPPRNPARRLPFRSSLSLALFMALFGLLVWHLAARYSGLPAFMLPAPVTVWDRFVAALRDGSLLRNTLATLWEILAGLGLGLVSATILGYLLAKSRSLERLLAPLVVASQSVPVVAIAPLLVIWFGPGLLSKVLICTLIVFFPVLINTIVGLRSVPDDLRDLMRSLQASRWQTFSRLEVPAALPVLFGGLRIGATLAVIGAVVGELVGSNRGLGFLISQARGIYDYPLVFVAVFTLVGLALALYGLVVLLEARLLAWQRTSARETLLAQDLLEEGLPPAGTPVSPASPPADLASAAEPEPAASRPDRQAGSL